MMREVSLETLPNVNIRDPSHDKNLPIMSVTGSINQNVFLLLIMFFNLLLFLLLWQVLEEIRSIISGNEAKMVEKTEPWCCII